MSAPVTDLTAHRLRWRLATAQADGQVPSIVAGIVRDGALVWSDGVGDVPGSITDTQYKVGSITKTLTAVLVLQLVEEGLLSLDAPAASVLGDVGYADRTIRQLLAHSGGLQAEPAGDWWERSQGGSFDDLAAANDGTAAAFVPDRQFHYSNLGYGLLGEVVARLREQTWWEAVRERILDPLAMKRTSYQASGVHAEGWSVHPYAQTLIPEPLPDTAAMAPAGQVWSTITDLATYCRFLLEGHDDVLGAAALARAFTPQAGEEHAGLAYAHGLGFQIFRGGSGTLVGHSGSMPGFHAICLVDRDRRTGVVALVNGTAGVPVAGFGAALLEELEAWEPALPRPWVPNETVPAELADALGVWHWGATPFVFACEGGDLVARRGQVEKWRFVAQEGRIVGSRGYHAGEELRVVRRSDGVVSHLDVGTFILTREPYEAGAPIPGGRPS
ncbi:MULTISPECIES: serine hydrolase domain-containing protein [Nocardioides]|uniref:serine hydrolase domain-containing protein n=1 Tax=Nocardioides TaxID=1839 RepID=UPI00032E00E3|nr:MULTISPECIES: serine hydrolase domain-containing protein [Nocardioides]EON24023.1 beta-lactamase [Nocardioides sp. CF8]